MPGARLDRLLAAPGHIAVLATADRAGQPNAAVFGSLRRLDEQTLALGLGDNRSLANLRQNPKATLLLCLPAPELLAWQGLRVALELELIETTGPLFDQFLAEATAQAGRLAARTLRQVTTFRINSWRPLIDLAPLSS